MVQDLPAPPRGKHDARHHKLRLVLNGLITNSIKVRELGVRVEILDGLVADAKVSFCQAIFGGVKLWAHENLLEMRCETISVPGAVETGSGDRHEAY